MRVEWLIIAEDDLSASEQVQQEFERWLRLHDLEDPPPDAVRVDVIRGVPVDRIRYRLSMSWLAEDVQPEAIGS